MQPGETVGSIFVQGTAVGLAPAELLERFAARRDEDAFAVLVGRHGPMVLATCRRILPNAADADDAFQATFLILARKAASITDPDRRLAAWLHGVARRVATRARADCARRQAPGGPTEPAAAEPDEVAVDPPPADAWEVRAILDEELARLPAKYRDVLVLCYLEGLTHDEAAGQLRCPVGTVRSRLAAGRARLRSRLARRGMAPGGAVILAPASLPLPVLSRPLFVATVQLGCAGLAGHAATSAALLAQGVLTSMLLTKIQITAVALLAVATTFAAGTTGLVIARQEPAAPPQPSAPAQPAPDRNLLLSYQRDRRQFQQLKDEIALISKQVEQLQFERDQQLLRLKNQLTAKEIQAEALQIAMRAKVAKLQATSAPVPAPAGPATPPQVGGNGPNDGAAAPPGAATPPAAPLEPPPTVQTVPGSPTILMVIAGAHDRVTMINPATQQRATLRLPHRVESIEAVTPQTGGQGFVLKHARSQEDLRLAQGLVGLKIASDRPENRVDKLAVFDRNAMRWFEHDLPQPATHVEPQLVLYSTLVGFGVLSQQPTRAVLAFDAQDRSWPAWTLPEPVGGFIPAGVTPLGTVACEAGRFVGIYQQDKRTWSVLERQPNDPQRDFLANTIRPISANLAQWHDGKLVVPEGDLIHLYDAEAAAWTHLDTKDDK